VSKKYKYENTNDENGQKLDAFFEMLEVLDTEHLVRFRYRLQKFGRKRMVEILDQEIKERDRIGQD